MSYRPIAVVLLLVFLGAPSAQAQVTLDVAKVTCMQFVHNKIGRVGALANWVSGYVNAKRDNTVVDVQDFQTNVKKLQSYCVTHHDELLMTAAKNALGLNQ